MQDKAYGSDILYKGICMQQITYMITATTMMLCSKCSGLTQKDDEHDVSVYIHSFAYICKLNPFGLFSLLAEELGFGWILSILLWIASERRGLGLGVMDAKFGSSLTQRWELYIFL